jgi:ABC-type cobalamin/Fe3+-siderophores transport systems, ATPase components
LLTGKNLSFSYDKKNKDKILNKISFSIEPGDFIGLIGTSGSGKTTLVKHLNGLLKADSGELLLDGVDLYKKKNY